MEQLLALLPILGTVAALSALALRLLAFGLRMLGFVLRLRAWERHQLRMQAAANEAARAALQPPPESPELPEGLSKHTVLVFALGSTAAGIGLVMRRPPEPPVMVRQQQGTAPPAQADPIEELITGRCETDQQCGVGCRCVSGNCRCQACDKKKGSRCTVPTGKDAGSSSGTGSKAPGPSSGIARSWSGHKMAGDLAWAGTL